MILQAHKLKYKGFSFFTGYLPTHGINLIPGTRVEGDRRLRILLFLPDFISLHLFMDLCHPFSDKQHGKR
jgi:hypothetical protein